MILNFLDTQKGQGVSFGLVGSVLLMFFVVEVLSPCLPTELNPSVGVCSMSANPGRPRL